MTAGRLVLMLLAAAATAAAAAGKPIRPKEGYRVFGEPYSKIFCELPKPWRLELFPAAQAKGEHQLFLAAKGKAASLAVYQYDGTHASLSSPDRYLAQEAKGASVAALSVGRSRWPAKSFERKTLERRELIVVIPARVRPRFCVVRYSAAPGEFLRYKAELQHLLDTWLFRNPDKGPRSGT